MSELNIINWFKRIRPCERLSPSPREDPLRVPCVMHHVHNHSTDYRCTNWNKKPSKVRGPGVLIPTGPFFKCKGFEKSPAGIEMLCPQSCAIHFWSLLFSNQFATFFTCMESKNALKSMIISIGSTPWMSHTLNLQFCRLNHLLLHNMARFYIYWIGLQRMVVC